MIVACLFLSILIGFVAASFALAAGLGVFVAALAYSLGGAGALVLSMLVVSMVAQARASPLASQLPPS